MVRNAVEFMHKVRGSQGTYNQDAFNLQPLKHSSVGRKSFSRKDAKTQSKPLETRQCFASLRLCARNLFPAQRIFVQSLQVLLTGFLDSATKVLAEKFFHRAVKLKAVLFIREAVSFVVLDDVRHFDAAFLQCLYHLV